ncbi:Holliday junction branch migration protein RuvA [Bacillus luteolus]|uniref:Holliday junction branch migration complex subunit RuvA n=1 Tax=Litchfieldia luteola TaxID=682179 RepID=A0ABR9QHZ5_9BACI|nr:Holliday junction branch migration protein RuvA [Cytobacillus luteolus]MBE4908119.1 Holliday junction branch migration protein RuvA [Cytobacillus luteolus]MBP1942904.1 Holliday junction DNA helicase RuvA [Cytobacillus luteolus]
MIEFIKGQIDFVNPEYIVVENNGVGYLIYTPNPFVFRKNKNEMVTIYTYQHVREDILALYGFQTREERALFMKLLNVSGIGPKGGLAILASGQPAQVVRAIENEDEKFLVRFPGIGKKTARQMILDLKGKLHDLVPEGLDDLFTSEDRLILESTSSEALDEAVEALKVLGYAEREIKKIIPELLQETMTTDQYIRKALQMLLK